MKFLMPIKNYLLFALTFISICACIGFAFWKGDRSALDSLPVILGVYCGTNASKTISAHVNARLDQDTNLSQVIDSTRER